MHGLHEESDAVDLLELRLKATKRILREYAASWAQPLPVARSCTLIVVNAPAEAKTLLSGLKATELTLSLWPVRVVRILISPNDA